MTLLYACLAMALKDAVYTTLTVAEARGRSLIAASTDALGDIAGVLITVYAAGPAIVHGWTWHAITILAAVCGTSFVGTLIWTRLANRWMPET